MGRHHVDKERAYAAGLSEKTVRTRLSRGWCEVRAYERLPYRALPGMCSCGCGNLPSVQVGARRYCAKTAAMLLGQP